MSVIKIKTWACATCTNVEWSEDQPTCHETPMEQKDLTPHPRGRV